MAQQYNMPIKMLYGENMMCSMPINVVDVSEIRQVPDNQEVFTHPLSDQSIIVEILEYVQEDSDQEALKTHFNELASSNEASEPDCARIICFEEIAGNQIALQYCESAYLLTGEQLISKFNESSKNLVHIYMALFRLPVKETDILVTMNDPASISPQSSSHCPGNDANASRWNADEFKAMVMSMKLVNAEFLG